MKSLKSNSMENLVAKQETWTDSGYSSAFIEFYGSIIEFITLLLEVNSSLFDCDDVIATSDTVKTNTNGTPYVNFLFYNKGIVVKDRNVMVYGSTRDTSTIKGGEDLSVVQFGAVKTSDGVTVTKVYKPKEMSKPKSRYSFKQLNG